MHLLETIVVSSLVIFGAYAAMGEGMVLAWFPGLIEFITQGRLMRWLRMPLYECPICMASIWGGTTYFIMGGPLSWFIFIHIAAVAGFNYIILNLFE